MSNWLAVNRIDQTLGLPNGTYFNTIPQNATLHRRVGFPRQRQTKVIRPGLIMYEERISFDVMAAFCLLTEPPQSVWQVELFPQPPHTPLPIFFFLSARFL